MSTLGPRASRPPPWKPFWETAGETPAVPGERRPPVTAIIIPCLNEEEPIADVVREVLAQSNNEVIIGEVIVVDNGSTDRTAERAEAAGARVVRESSARLWPGLRCGPRRHQAGHGDRLLP